MRAVRATVGSIMILDRERTVLKLAASRGIPDEVIPAVEVKVGEGVAGKVVEMGEPVLVDDIAADPRFNRTNNPQYGNGSFICMPIRVGDRVIGVINMAKKRDGGVSDALRLPPFGSTDLQFLNALMTYIGYAVDNSRLLEEAQSSASQLQGVVDDLKSTQAQLVRGETLRAMGQLSSGMAHHLNNLFAVILGRVELLMGKVQEAGVRRSLEIIQRTAQDGAEVVRRVQRFSRVQPVSDAVAVDLNQLVQEVVELTRPRWQDEAQLRGSRIEVAVEAGVIGAAAGEPAPLREVLMNLLLNAADSITQAGKITLKTWTRDDRVYCSVADTGGGMPEEVRRRALEPFFTTKGPKATGLGLSVAYGTVQRYGGTLTVESTEGQGTTVEVSLPTASAAASVARTAHRSAERAGRAAAHPGHRRRAPGAQHARRDARGAGALGDPGARRTRGPVLPRVESRAGRRGGERPGHARHDGLGRGRGHPGALAGPAGRAHHRVGRDRDHARGAEPGELRDHQALRQGGPGRDDVGYSRPPRCRMAPARLRLALP